MNKFSQRLAYAMQNNNISSADLSRKTGISAPTISRYLSGEFEAKQNNVHILSVALGVTPSWLMGFDEATPKEDLIEVAVGILSKLSDENKTQALDYLRYLKTKENQLE